MMRRWCAFARAFIQARQRVEGAIEDVPSPTFTLIQTYQTQAAEIWHADLYRLSDPSEIAELGLLDAGPSAILLVEWPERAGDAWPGSAHRLRFETTGPDSRRLTLSRVDGTPQGSTLSQALAAR